MKYIFILFVVSLLIQQFFYWFFYVRYALKPVSSKPREKSLPLSVVVCAKNEAQHLMHHLPLILTQNYPLFEVVVVDDHSIDETESVLISLKENYENLQIVNKKKVPNRPGKKAALYTGVLQATYEHIVVTDADCEPVSVNWLRHMNTAFEPGINLVLGVSPNENEAGFWKRFFAYETVWTAINYISFALGKLPYMGVGRNMGFTKLFFLQQFKPILKGNIASGDDDLLVNSAANKNNTALCLDPESFTLSKSPSTFSKWINQKSRHLTAGFGYKFLHKLLLSLYPIVSYLLIITAIILLATKIWSLILLCCLFILTVHNIIIGLCLRKLKQAHLSTFALLYHLMWLLIQPFLTFKSLIQSKSKWT